MECLNLPSKLKTVEGNMINQKKSLKWLLACHHLGRINRQIGIQKGKDRWREKERWRGRGRRRRRGRRRV